MPSDDERIAEALGLLAGRTPALGLTAETVGTEARRRRRRRRRGVGMASLAVITATAVVGITVHASARSDEGAATTATPAPLPTASSSRTAAPVPFPTTSAPPTRPPAVTWPAVPSSPGVPSISSMPSTPPLVNIPGTPDAPGAPGNPGTPGTPTTGTTPTAPPVTTAPVNTPAPPALPPGMTPDPVTGVLTPPGTPIVAPFECGERLPGTYGAELNGFRLSVERVRPGTFEEPLVDYRLTTPFVPKDGWVPSDLDATVLVLVDGRIVGGSSPYDMSNAASPTWWGRDGVIQGTRFAPPRFCETTMSWDKLRADPSGVRIAFAMTPPVPVDDSRPPVPRDDLDPARDRYLAVVVPFPG